MNAVFLSFCSRGARHGGGSMVSRNFHRMVQQAYSGGVLDIFHDDPAGCRATDGFAIAVQQRSNFGMLWRLGSGKLGRLRFRFSEGFSGTGEVDLVIDGAGFAEALTLKPGRFRRALVLHQNFEPDYYADAFAGHILASWYVRAGLKAQRTAFRRASLNLFVTRQDLEKTRKACGEPRGMAEVLGVYEPVTPLPTSQRPRDPSISVLVSGNLSARKGYLGLIEMFAAIRERKTQLRPKMRFIVAGGHPTGEVRSLADSNFIQVIENPESVDELAQSCDLYLNPNYTGSGIKVRNLDGLRNGLPVFCRTENAAGFDDIEAPAFQTFSTVAEGVDRLEALNAAEVKSERMRTFVWQAYAGRFDLRLGVARLKCFLEGRRIVPRHGIE